LCNTFKLFLDWNKKKQDKFLRFIKESGAKKIYVVATHGLFNDSAVSRMNKLVENGNLDAVICTNSVYQSDVFKSSLNNYHEVGVESYVAKVIMNLHEGHSLSDLLR